MFKNYFITAIRSIQKKKFFAFINVIGLSIGICCFCLLSLYIANEKSFDTFNENASDIYRPYIWSESLRGQPSIAYTDYSGPTDITLGEAMKQNLSGVEDYVRLQLPNGESLMRVNGNVHRIKMTFADPSLFSIFNFPIQYGDAHTALAEPNDVVITTSMAKELFSKSDVVGNLVEIKIGKTFQTFKVSAVTKDVPENSTIRFEVLGNFRYALANNDHLIIGHNWHPTIRMTYVQLTPGSTLPGDKNRLANFLQTFNPNFINDLKSAGYSWQGKGLPVTLRMQPLLSIHTDINFVGWGFVDYQKIDPKTIWILLAIASGILLIACINFTTLAIARSAGRSREVGIRKVTGANKRQLVLQFLAEAILFSSISTILGLTLSNFGLPWFNQLAARHIHFYSSSFLKLGVFLMGVILFVGLLAGGYPAFVLSNFKPIEVLKNKIRIGGSNLLTKSLITFQFVLSVGLITSTMIILRQTNFMMNKNPGFNSENVVVLDASEVDPGIVFPRFKQALEDQTSIGGVASAAAGLGAGENFLGYSDAANDLFASINIIDTSYIQVLGMKLIAGRNFDEVAIRDTIRPMIINETMMHAFGWNSQNAIGKEIENFQGRKAIVIGVVKNFYFNSLSKNIVNQAFITSKDKGYVHFYIRTKANKIVPALAAIKKAWNNAAPEVPIKFSFLDEDLNSYYQEEQRWSSIVAWSSAISIFLSCLGLLGLAGLTAVNRTKEIGVRKVFGASVSGIVGLLSKDYIRLVIISSCIAAPITWYFMNEWLQHYAEHIQVHWWIFGLAGILAIFIAFFTIAFQTFKAASINPVESLRSE